jgi:hypothetical protein
MQLNFLKILFLFLMINNCHSLIIESLCGYPGKPYKSTISYDKAIYNENDEVFYNCENTLIDMVQKKKCFNGTWIGNKPLCGKKILKFIFNC